MGADLYIQSVYEPARAAAEPAFKAACDKRDKLTDKADIEAAQKDVDAAYDAMNREDCYFRDSYNCSSVLNVCGLSWWKDITPMLNAKGDLSPRKAAKLADTIEACDLKLPTLEELDARNADVSRGVESWHDYYRAKRDRLVKFLRHAAELKQPVRCSL